MMPDTLTVETKEQRTRFFLEVAALMGNQSATKILAEMNEKGQPKPPLED